MTDVEFLKANHIAPCKIAEPLRRSAGITATVTPFVIFSLIAIGLSILFERYV